MPDSIRLSAGDVSLAREWERAIMRSRAVTETANHTGLSAGRRYYVGYLGELALGRMLEREGAVYLHRVSVVGASQLAEYRVMLQEDGRPRWKTVEVKTRNGADSTRFMFPDAQLARDTSDVYVGCKLEEDGRDHAIVSVCGWLSRDEIHGLEVKPDGFGRGTIPTRWCFYKDMHPMSELMSRAVKNRVVQWPEEGEAA